MTHKLKTETFSQKIKHSDGAMCLPLTPLFSFVTFHLKSEECFAVGDGSNPSIALFCWSFSFTSFSFHLTFVFILC